MLQQQRSLVILNEPGKSEYYRELYQTFERPLNGFAVFMANSVSEARNCVDTQPVDALIIHDTDANRQLVHSLLNSDSSHYDPDPIICVLTDETSPHPALNEFDVVLPYVPPEFVHQALCSQLKVYYELLTAKRHQDEITLLKNAIVRNVSHELKTPLLQVKSAVALIAEDMVDDKLSRMAVQATARLEAVVKNITLLADSMKGNSGPVLVQESIDQAVRNLRRIWIHKQEISRIQLRVDSNIPPVIADKHGISIVMQQLLDNALKFSQDVVYVDAHRCEEGVYVAVQDFGIGIAEDKIKQIFESFYQVDSSVTQRYGGTGVGLAIVRLIMEKHQVEIHVESRLGEGSTFSFVLPQAML